MDVKGKFVIGLMTLLFIAVALSFLPQKPMLAQGQHVQGYSYSYPTVGSGTYSISNNAGVLHSFFEGVPIAAATTKIYDIAASGCSSTPASGFVMTITDPATAVNPYELDLNILIKNGICVVKSGSTGSLITYE